MEALIQLGIGVWFGGRSPHEILSELEGGEVLKAAGLYLLPGERYRRGLVDRIADGGVELYSPGCADYSYGQDGTPDLRTVSSGPGRTNLLILRAAPLLIKFFLEHDIKVKYGLVLAEVEAEDDFRCQRMDITSQEFLNRIRSSVGNLRGELVDRLSAAGIAQHPLLDAGVYLMRQDGFYTEDDERLARERLKAVSRSKLIGNASQRRRLYQKWLEGKNLSPSEFHAAMLRIAARYMEEFMAFAANMQRRNAAVLSTDDSVMARLYRVPCFILPKTGLIF